MIKDDIGKDGDDIVYEFFDFYSILNVFQLEINFFKGGDLEKVDVVFIDFIQLWIILVLKFSGGDYSDEDVKDYMEGIFIYKML